MPGNFATSNTISDVLQTPLSQAMVQEGPLRIPSLDDDDDGQDQSKTFVSRLRSQAVHDSDKTQMEVCEDTRSSFAQV